MSHEAQLSTLHGIKSVYNYLQAAVNRPCETASDKLTRNESITAFNILKIHLADELTAMGLDVVMTEY